MSRYTAADCPICHGQPPQGFTCMRCLTYEWPRGEAKIENNSTLERFGDIKLGDTSELDPIWDRFTEHPDGLYLLALRGIDPIVMSRLFRMVLDVVNKERQLT